MLTTVGRASPDFCNSFRTSAFFIGIGILYQKTRRGKHGDSEVDVAARAETASLESNDDVNLLPGQHTRTHGP